MTVTELLPGLEAVTLRGDDARLSLGRSGPNSWWLAMAGSARDTPSLRLVGDALSADSRCLPSVALGRAREDGDATGDVVCCRIELDECGAWFTLSNSGRLRPSVLRRAGWIDLRGFTRPPLDVPRWQPLDDRVGLGPGDAIVLVTSTRDDASDASPWPSPSFPDRLLAAAGNSAMEIASTAASFVSGAAPVLVVKVPDDLGDDPRERVALATGIAAEDLELPGYPLGDVQPDLWNEPPAPPREARLALRKEPARLRGLRSMLRRLVASWRLDGRISTDDLELLATEMASNAIEHGEVPGVVVVRYDGTAVRVEVGDGSVEVPQPMLVDRNEDGGRGLVIIDALSTRWGVIPTVEGKRVWFELAV